MVTALLIVHGLVAVALLGAISHQALATWAPSRARPGSFFGRFRSVPSASFANAIVILYAVSALLGGIMYLYFRIDIRPELERAGEWPALGLFDIKEHFVSIGLALLPAYWVCWRRPRAGEPARTRAALTSILAVIVWWGFLIGHVVNNIEGLRQHDVLTASAASHSPTGQRSPSSTWSRSSWISRCSLSIPRSAWSCWAHTIREISPLPRWRSWLPRCTGTVGPPRPRSERSCSGSLPRSCPSDGRSASGRGGSGWFPRSR